MKHGYHNALSLLLFAFLLILAGCGGGESAPAGSQRGTVSLQASLSGLLAQTVAADPGAGALNANALTQTFTGELTAINTDTLESVIVPWSVLVDDVTLQIDSLSTLVLAPGTYDIFLVVNQGTQQYAGSALVSTIAEGNNTIAMTLRPVIGDTIVDVNIISLLAEFDFQYDPAELAGFFSPRVGVILDGGVEEVFSVDPLTGIAGTLLANIAPGMHNIRIKFYDGGLQRGKSIVAQEDVFISGILNQPIVIDLVPPLVEIASQATELDGLATFEFLIPPEVVEEAGGVAMLNALFLVAGPSAPPLQQEVLLTVTPSGDDYYLAQVSLAGFRFGDVTLGIVFTDNRGTPADYFDDKLIGICIEENVLISFDETPKTTLCGITLLRRSIIGANLIATLAVNTSNAAAQPVPGAVVKRNGKAKNITGSGAFGTPGFSKIFLRAGTHTIEAVKEEADGTSTFGSEVIDIVDPALESTLDIMLL